MKEEKEEEKETKQELVRILEPTVLSEPKDLVTSTDMLAYLLLKDFIASGYPAIDPRKQVDAAYSYAELMTQRRKK